MNGRKPFLGLLHRREFLVPTWRGWLVLLIAAATLLTIAIRGIYGFLAINVPVPGGLLVVEGWSSDYILAEAIAEYRQNHYNGVFVTGGPLEVGAPLIEYKTFAHLGAARLIRMGIKSDAVHPVPAEAVIRDRTYASAVALRKWLPTQGITATKINIIGNGPHSRRTRLLYEKVFENKAEVGIITTAETDFNPKRWWASSEGFRIVVGETIAYAYARLLFSPRKE